jgi:SAM-dependent methyltransferase
MWPFWAPSRTAAVGRALTLAGLAPGERFVDLGCGDGRVLVAAARRGARVLGIEFDPDLVDTARRRMARAGLPGEVVHGDIFETDVDADVVFTYLTPGTLQELTPRFQAMTPDTRLVTLDFAVPDLEPERSTKTLNLYRLPAPERRVGAGPGWPADATLVVTVPDRQSLTCIELVHAGGPVDLDVSAPLRERAAVKVGAVDAGAGRPVAVDLRWEGAPAGTVVRGQLAAGGVGAHPVFALFADEDGGQWELTEEAARRLDRRLGDGPAPSSSAELLAVATSEVA